MPILDAAPKELIFELSWFPNLCSFGSFDKRDFGFVGIKFIVFFFLATILIMVMFNFQFWVRIKIGSWHYLKCCTSLLFFTFLNVLLNKSNCFRTVELHVVQLIVILFHLTALTDLILYYFSLLHYWSSWTKYSFLHILWLFARSQVKTLIVKFRLLPRKTSVSGVPLTLFY